MARGRSGQPGAPAVSAVRTEPDIAPGIVQVLHQPMAGKTVMGQAAKSRTVRQKHVQFMGSGLIGLDGRHVP